MSFSKKKIYFRADGNSVIGLGHVIRSLALAEMLMEQFDPVFMIQNPSNALKKQILQVCADIIALKSSKDLEKEVKDLCENYFTEDDIVVLDGYYFNANYQKVIKRKKVKLVVIDDLHNFHSFADVIINHGGGVKPSLYSTEPYTKFCLGLDYVLLRKPFRIAAQEKKIKVEKNAIFICLGGADPDNEIIEILKTCKSLSVDRRLYIIIGSAYQHIEILKTYLNKSSLDFELLQNLNAEEMVFYMSKCGIGITSPSGVSYEYLSVGGILYLYTIADNQKHIHHFLTSNKLAFDFKQFPKEVDEKALQSRLNNFFDGGQQERFIRIFEKLSNT